MPTFLIECGVFWLYCLFLALNNFFIQKLPLYYRSISLMSTTFWIKFLYFLILFHTHNQLISVFKKDTRGAFFYHLFQFLVELPDTASGSEKSPWYHSTCIVPCFILVTSSSDNRTKLLKPMTKFSRQFSSLNRPYSLFYNNLDLPRS